MTIYWQISDQGIDVWEDSHDGNPDHRIDGPVSWLGERPDEIKLVLSDAAITDWMRGDVERV